MEQSPLNKHLVPIAIVVAGMFIAAAIYFGGNTNVQPIAGVGNPQEVEGDIAPVTGEDHVIGSVNADLVVIEYSDTECPYCKVFHNTMHQVVNDYKGRVAWVYRHFPIAQLHARAAKEAEATECAAELGGNDAFWRYIDKVFELTNSNDSLDPNELPKIAVSIGLNEAAFNSCLTSGRYTDFIAESVENAVKAGARGTPHSIILTRGGQKMLINGAEPLASVKAKIDSLLK